MDKSILWKLSYGLYAVCLMDGQRPSGCIVNTFFQVTSGGVVAVSMNRDNYTHSLIEKHNRFGVCILSESTPARTIGALGFFSGRDKEKFAGLDYRMHEGIPLLNEGCCGYLILDVVGRYETDTHTVFFAQVEDAFAGVDIRSMTYEYYRSVIKGKSPKNAPTYGV
ncbi:MAG: High molecular weight rubredoxin [Firmicutes bacterium ADurb.Bin182]|nr:MAG: High molecular weight rubredoxin [Firmicutes bacterium ADurb.Bin182]